MPSEPPGSGLNRRQPRGGLSGARRSRTERSEARVRRSHPRRNELTLGSIILAVKPSGARRVLDKHVAPSSRVRYITSEPVQSPAARPVRGPSAPYLRVLGADSGRRIPLHLVRV